MGRRQEWAEGTSDYSPGLTEFQPRRYGTRSDGMELGVTAGRRGAPRWSEALAVIVMAGLPGKGQSWGRA